MKKRIKIILLTFIFAVILTIFGTVTVSAEVDITDDFIDLNFKAAVLDFLDKGPTDRIYDIDVENIWFLEVSGQNISIFSGIEHFTTLTGLICDDNQLTGLDISNNTDLTYLSCGNNQLTELDVSKNTDLTTLWCNNNQLTELDVSNNIALTNLYCYENQLTELDISNNTALTKLYCSSNQLTELDVSKNTALIEFWCNFNNMESPDDITGWEEIGLILDLNFYPQNPKIKVLNETGWAEQIITVDVKIENNPGIAAYTLNINYNPNVLEYTGIDTNGLININPDYIKVEPDGRIKIVGWEEENVTDDGLLFALRFKIKNETPKGVYPITLSYTSNGDIANENEIFINPVIINGSITVVKKIIYGDLNDDGIVDVLDLVYLARHIAEIDIITDLDLLINADVTGDGKVNIADLIRLARHLAGYDVAPLGQPLA